MIFRKQKRILVFNDSLVLGGTEKLLVNFLNHLIEKNCTVTLLLPEETDENILLPEVSEEVNIRYLYKSNKSRCYRKRSEIKMIFRTKSFLKRKHIKEADFDEVICFKEGFYAKMFARMTITKTLWLHNMFYVRTYETNSLRQKLSAWLNKKQVCKVHDSYALYDRVIAVSEACKQSYINIIFGGNIPIQDIRVVPNAIDLNKLKIQSQECIEPDTALSKTKFILLTRISPDKRIDRLIDAVRMLKKDGLTEFIVHVIGTDSEEISSQIYNSDLQEQIRLHGRVTNPYPYVVQSDWALCVSERESFSLAILEAMALGVPVIATDCGGPGNIIENGKYGLLVENSSQGVYEGMRSVLLDKTLSKKYQMDLDKAVARYDYGNWQKTIDKLFSLR